MDQRAEIAEINLMADRIKKEYLRKFTFQIGMATCSAGAAILSAVAAVQEPVALLGVGLGSAGVSAAVAKIAESWIDFKGDLDELREKDSYILWRIRQRN